MSGLAFQDQKKKVDNDKNEKLSKFVGVMRFVVPIVFLLFGIGIGIRYYLAGQTKDNSLELSGRIEGHETDVGAKLGGKIENIAVREGDLVASGQVIAQLDDAELQAQLKGAEARLQAARQDVNQAQLEIEVINSQIDEAQLSLRQSSDDAVGEIARAQAKVAAARAQLSQAQSEAKQAQAQKRLARADLNRYEPLIAEGVITQQRFDQSQTNFDTSKATLRASQAAVVAARRQVNVFLAELTQAKTSSFNPQINQAKLTGLNKQLAQSNAQVEADKADVENAKAAKAEIVAKLDDLQIVSPINGVVLARTTEPGEVVASGTNLMTIVNLNNLYLRGYLPEGEIGNVRVGQPAQIFLDSAPDRPLDASVTKVDAEASFTPENIYFRSDRVDQVFGLRLNIDNPNGFAKPGMPADGEIITQPEEGEHNES